MTFEHSEVRTSVVAHGAWIRSNALVRVDVILEMMFQLSDECAFCAHHQSFGWKMFVFMFVEGFLEKSNITNIN